MPAILNLSYFSRLRTSNTLAKCNACCRPELAWRHASMIGIRDFSKSGGKSGARPSKIVKINRNVLWNPRFWKVSAEWPQSGPRAKFSRPVYEFEFVTVTERPIFLISLLNIHSLLHRLFVFHKFQINILSQSKKWYVCCMYFLCFLYVCGKG